MQIFTFITLFGLSCLLSACHKTQSAAPPPLQISTALAHQDSMTMRYTFPVHLQSNYRAVIQPRVNGYLVSKNYPAGGRVKRGDILFEIETSLLNTTLRSAEASLAAAIAEQATARSNYQRAIPLARLEAISASQLEAYRATYSSAEGRVKAAREEVENARLQIGYARIYSPIDGIAAQSEAHNGDYVGPATQFSTLTTIEATDTLTADVAIPTSLYMLYRATSDSSYDNASLLSDITLHLSNGEQYPYAGSYGFTRQAISPTAGTITLVVKFPNPDLRLKAGEYGQVECGIGARQRVISVPQQAVNTLQGKHIVWVILPDSTAQWREVSLGPTYQGRWIIRSGVAAGERVAIEGSQKLRNGAKVIPKNEE